MSISVFPNTLIYNNKKWIQNYTMNLQTPYNPNTPKNLQTPMNPQTPKNCHTPINPPDSYEPSISQKPHIPTTRHLITPNSHKVSDSQEPPGTHEHQDSHDPLWLTWTPRLSWAHEFQNKTPIGWLRLWLQALAGRNGPVKTESEKSFTKTALNILGARLGTRQDFNVCVEIVLFVWYNKLTSQMKSVATFHYSTEWGHLSKQWNSHNKRKCAV